MNLEEIESALIKIKSEIGTIKINRNIHAICSGYLTLSGTYCNLYRFMENTSTLTFHKSSFSIPNILIGIIFSGAILEGVSCYQSQQKIEQLNMKRQLLEQEKKRILKK